MFCGLFNIVIYLGSEYYLILFVDYFLRKIYLGIIFEF